MSYYDILLAKQLSGGGGGGDITVESLSVTANGTYSAPSGKAYSPVVANVPNSYTASDEGKVVSNGALVAQTSQTIDTNGTYDTTLKNSVTVNVSGGGGGNVIVGALRPDAELWKTYTYDKYVVRDGVIASIPAYSTSSLTLVASATLETLTLDTSTYDYIAVCYALVIPVYANKGGKGTEYFTQSKVFEIAELSDGIKRIGGGSSGASFANAIKYMSNIINLYSEADGSGAAVSTSAGYGVTTTIQALNISNNSWTIATPTLNMRGSTTQMTQAAWGTLTDIRWQYIIKIYRAPKSNQGVNGFSITSMTNHVQQCVANGGTLT